MNGQRFSDDVNVWAVSDGMNVADADVVRRQRRETWTLTRPLPNYQMRSFVIRALWPELNMVQQFVFAVPAFDLLPLAMQPNVLSSCCCC